MIRGLYGGVAEAAGPALRLYLARRARRGKEDEARLAERFGVASCPRPGGPLVWVHGASVGEAVSALPVIARLTGDPRGVSVLVTTGTVSSARLLAARLPEDAIHQYIPLDRPGWVRRFLDHWRPDLALWIESEIWPATLGEMAKRSIPAVLLNARMSARSLANWRRVPGLARGLLATFSAILAQSEADAARFAALGADGVLTLGNLKDAGPPLPADEDDLSRLRTALAGRPVWVAASTHPGEEDAVGAAHRVLASAHPGLLTILAPRHAPRGEEVATALRAQGLTIARRSAGEAPEPGTDIYLADTMGELGLVYRLSGIAFVGGSLVPHGGQNPLEPARLGCAVLFGPHMENFADAASRLTEAGAAEIVADANALPGAVGRLLSDPALLVERQSAARRVADGGAAVLDRVMHALEPYLERAAGRAGPTPDEMPKVNAVERHARA